MIFLISILAVFFAINMGSASFAASFATPYGSNIIDKRKAGILFIIFVIIGSLLFGKNVTLTLGEEIMPSHLLSQKAIIIIFLSAGLSMFIANMMQIPQSTSLVTVASIAGVGSYYQQLNSTTITNLAPYWIALPIMSYGLTYYIAKYLYPPKKSNFWVYEKFVNQQSKLKKLVVASSCYSALSVGSNNVPNVVGPLLNSGYSSLLLLLLIFAFFYGIGAFVFTGPLKTTGNKFVPLGLMTASVISIVSGSLMIFASCLGIPQSFVMLQLGAIFAIASLKNGPHLTFSNSLVHKTFYTWTINPVITFMISYGLSWLILERPLLLL